MVQDKTNFMPVLVGLLLLLALAGCGGATGMRSTGAAQAEISAGASAPGAGTPAAPAQAAPATGLTALPRPSTLLRAGGTGQPGQAGKSASYTNNDLAMDGSDFDQTLPKQNFSISSKEVTLMPSYTGQPVDLTGLSYVTYHFQAPGYDRNPQVRLDWSTAPVAAQTLWLGLSRWDKDRWDWYEGSLSGITDLPFIDKYFNFSGDLLLIVARTGTDWSTHGGVSLGGPTPVAAISADITEGDTPLNVHLDASASNPVEGTITKYEWDADGDGVYETDSGTTPTLDTVYSSNGTFQAAVRVTNDINATDEAVVEIVAVGPWQHTWGLGSNDEFTCAGADADGNIYAAGSFSQLLNYDIVLAKFNPAGTLIWAKSYDSGEDEFCADLQLNASGQIILGGSQDFSGNRQGLVQKWTAGGQLLWTKRFGAGSYDRVDRLLVDDVDIYAAGMTDSVSLTTDVFVTRLDNFGDIAWTRSRDFGAEDYTTDLSARYDLLGDLAGVIVTLDAKLANDYNIVKLEYDTTGAYDGGAQLGTDAQPKRYGHIVRFINLFTLETMYYIGGTVDVGFGAWPFIAKTNGAGAAIFGNALETSAGPRIEDMAFDSTGINLCGFMLGGGGDNVALLAKFNSGTGDVIGAETWATASNAVRGSAILPFRGGVLLSGKAYDNSGSWSPVVADHSAVNLSFAVLNGSGAQPAWATTSGAGVPVDVTADGVLDTGAGVDDGLLLFRPEL